MSESAVDDMELIVGERIDNGVATVPTGAMTTIFIAGG